MSLGKPRRAVAVALANALALVAAALVLLGSAKAAAAATVSVDRPCYVERDGNGIDLHPFTIGISASGLPAGKIVSFELLGGRDFTNHWLESVPADGNVSFPWEDKMTESTAPVAEQHPLKVLSLSGDTVYAETTVWMAHYGMKVSDAHTEDGERVRFQFAGLASGRGIWAHYVAHGKEVFSHKLGVTAAPCGALEATSPLYPARHSRFNSYLVQFDQKEKFSPKTRPRFRHGLETGKY